MFSGDFFVKYDEKFQNARENLFYTLGIDWHTRKQFTFDEQFVYNIYFAINDIL